MSIETRLSSLEAKSPAIITSDITIDWDHEIARYNRLLPDLEAIRKGKIRS